MKITPKRLKFGLNIWFPFRFCGIKVLEIKDDWSYAKVRLRKKWYNKNAVGTHYGGSLFSMTDPFYMLMTYYQIGKEYVVWDKKAEIKFIKATRKDVFAEYHLSRETLEDWKQQLETAEKIEPVFEVDIKDAEGNMIAKVWKTLYIRKKH